MSVVSLCLLCIVSLTRGAMRPNIVVIMADDLGWGNVGWHNPQNRQIKTPNLDALAATGLELSRMYVYRGCAPSRSSFQSGRLPVHVTTDNHDGMSTANHGMPAQMTGIASKFKEADYATHLIGKWDAGFASFAHLPISKGYDSFFGYLGKAIGYFDTMSYNDCPKLGDVDLWEDDHPAFESVEALSEYLKDDGGYIEFTFKRKMLDLLNAYADGNSSQPFFAMYSSHLPHFPAQIPQDRLEADVYGFDESLCADQNDYVFPGMTDEDAWECRSIAQSQVHLLDEIVGDIVDRLKRNGLWDNTLLIFQSDNGGSLQLDSSAGNNYPLRGGKGSDFEGGIRAVTVVNGGVLPEARRGQVEDGLMHIADWYVTFCAMLGVDAKDQTAIDAGLPDVEGYDLWPLISGAVTESPRTELAISSATLISGEWKLMRGSHIEFARWQRPVWPDASTSSDGLFSMADAVLSAMDCSPPNRCLFNVVSDISEFENVANVFPDVYDELSARMDALSESFYENDRTGRDACPNNYRLTVKIGYNEFTAEEVELPCGCWMALHNYNGFDGPWQDVPEQYVTFADSEQSQNAESGEQKIYGGEHEREEFEIGGDGWFEWITDQKQLVHGHAHLRNVDGIDVEMLEASQQNLEVVRAVDTRWSTQPKVEHAEMRMALLSLAIIMACVSGVYRLWSSRKQNTDMAEAVSTATTYGSNDAHV